MEMIGTLLTSSVIAAIVAAAVAVWTTQKRISIENITQDRRAWREKIREKALMVHDALIARDEQVLNRLRSEFRALLNPRDPDDNEIISCIRPLNEGKEFEHADEFAERVSLLLKHDWERVKLEAGPLIMRVKCVRDQIKKLIYEPEREKFKRP
jgi:hypothetical protein